MSPTRPCRTQSVLCGQPAALTLHTADAYGNVCTSGGHDVAFVHQAAGANKAYKVLPVPRLGCVSKQLVIRKHLFCAPSLCVMNPPCLPA